MTYQEFQAVIERKEFGPVILLYGDEDFLIDECTQAVVAGILDEGKKGFNLDVVQGSRADVKEVIAHASAFPMMSERRVVVVKEFEKLATSESAKELLSSYIKKPLESTCFLLVAARPDFRKKPFTDLKKHGELVECKGLYDNQVPSWIAQRVQYMGKSADPEACRLLQAYTGNSLRALQNELDKLFVFVGEKKSIGAEDVSSVVGASKGYTIFELQNAIGRKDLRMSLEILQAMLQAGQSPQMMIVMLTRFFIQLWKLGELKSKHVPETSMAKEIGVHPYFIRQIVQFESNYSTRHVQNNFRVLLEADAILKSTSRDPRLVMDFLLYSLVKGMPEQEQILT